MDTFLFVIGVIAGVILLWFSFSQNNKTNWLRNKNLKFIKMNNEVYISVPDGYEIDKVIYKKKEITLPTRWTEMGKVNGYSILESNNKYHTVSVSNSPLTIVPTLELKNAFYALTKLIQIRDRYNDGWLPNWENDNPKPCLKIYKNKVISDVSFGENHILAFKSATLRSLFYKNFKSLIETAKPLL